jgi:hypothetical protein
VPLTLFLHLLVTAVLDYPASLRAPYLRRGFNAGLTFPRMPCRGGLLQVREIKALQREGRKRKRPWSLAPSTMPSARTANRAHRQPRTRCRYPAVSWGWIRRRIRQLQRTASGTGSLCRGGDSIANHARLLHKPAKCYRFYRLEGSSGECQFRTTRGAGCQEHSIL